MCDDVLGPLDTLQEPETPRPLRKEAMLDELAGIINRFHLSETSFTKTQQLILETLARSENIDMVEWFSELVDHMN